LDIPLLFARFFLFPFDFLLVPYPLSAIRYTLSFPRAKDALL
jgi:hypothetical protein